MLTPAMFAIFSFFSVWSYRCTEYLSPIPALYEAFAFVSVFFLMINYLVPLGKFSDQIAYFSTRSYGKKQKPGYESFRNWYILILQFLPIRLATTIASEILTVVTCVGDREYKRAQTVVSIINTVTGIVAIFGLFGCLRTLYSIAKLCDSKVIGKLVLFKLIVLLGLVQGLVLRIMSQAGALEPTSTLSYNDLNLGLEPFLLCCEAFLLSCGMIYFYNPRLHGTNGDYVFAGQPGSLTKDEGLALEEGLNRKAVNPRMGVARALLDIVNMWDVIKGLIQALWLVRHWKPASR
jgi:Organic solute transporter Ostalpha